MLKTLIIEDEPHAAKLLSQVITEYCPKLEVIGILDNVDGGYEFLRENDVDVLFLDIQLADRKSFELLDLVPNNKYKIIFITAYEEYALKAFKYNAIDYVLKPFSPRDIIQAVDKIKINDVDEKIVEKLSQLFFAKENKINDKLVIHTSSGIDIIKFTDVIHIEAEGSYSYLYTIDGKKKMYSKTLKELEAKLCNDEFFRVHSSHLVNKNHVKRISSDEGNHVVLSNGVSIPISRRMKQDFINFMMDE
jgi:two-component system LytT family response regulator